MVSAEKLVEISKKVETIIKRYLNNILCTIVTMLNFSFAIKIN